MTVSAPTILWFRRDLRLADNPALTAAVETGAPLVALFILDETDGGHWPLGGAARWWLHHSLASLDHDLRRLGVRAHAATRRGRRRAGAIGRGDRRRARFRKPRLRAGRAAARRRDRDDAAPARRRGRELWRRAAVRAGRHSHRRTDGRSASSRPSGAPAARGSRPDRRRRRPPGCAPLRRRRASASRIGA